MHDAVPHVKNPFIVGKLQECDLLPLGIMITAVGLMAVGQAVKT